MTKKARAPEIPNELIESLFERGAPLYPTTAAELEAVARGDKGNCEMTAREGNQVWISRFIAEATFFGLTVSRREISLAGDAWVMLCATRPGEEWRAEVLSWVFNPETSGFVRSEQSTYFRSRALGYTHEQAVEWVALCRHQTPAHNCEPIHFVLPVEAAHHISRANGQLVLRESITIVFPHLFYGGLRRNALELLPAGLAIGRSALKQGTLSTFFHYEPSKILVSECSATDCALLAQSLAAPIDFWTGTAWSADPVSS